MEKNHIEKLNKLLEVIKDDTVSKKDIESFLKGILKYVADQKKEVSELSAYTANEIQEAVKYFEDEKKKLLTEITEIAESKREDVIQEVSTVENNLQEKVDAINTLLESIKVTPVENGYTPIKGVDYFDGEPGADAVFDSKELIAQVLSEIPKAQEYELLGENVVNILNDLPIEEEYQIDASHIKNLPVIKGGAVSRLLSKLYDVNVGNVTNGQTLIWNSTTNKWEAGAGGGGGSGWSLTGNSGTTAGTNFIGTTDAQDLVFKVNTQEKLRILNTGSSNEDVSMTLGKITAGELILKFREDQTETFQVYSTKSGTDMTTTFSTYASSTSIIDFVTGNGTAGYIRLSPQTAVEIRDRKPLRFWDSGNNYYAGFRAGASMASDITWTLPSTDSTGTQALVSNGSGVLSWSSVGGFAAGTGLTDTAGTITANLSTGVSGGQSVIGGTASGNNLTLSSTSHATKGGIVFGSASMYDENLNYLGIGTVGPTSKIDITTSGLGTTQATTSGLSLINRTVASAGSQQMSPALIWQGRGWKTNATASSQVVSFMADMLPVQGTANPSGIWKLKYSVDGGAYSDILSISSAGAISPTSDIVKRVVTASDATSITPNTDSADITYQNNTQAVGTLTINADAGTPINGRLWILKIKSTNVQTFSWNSVFVGGTGAYPVTLPTSTTANGKIDLIGFMYDTVNSKWQCVSIATGY